MTRIEADATLGAPPPAVWELLIDHERWPEWFRSPADGASAGLRLDAVTLVSGAPDRVGTERRCSATLGPLPLRVAGSARVLRWTDRIADVHAPWLLALDVEDAPPPFRRARLRLILVEGPAGQARLRLRLTYVPGAAYWLLDALWLRRALADGLRRALDGLRARYPAAPSAAPTSAQPPAPAPSGRVRAAA